MSKKRNKKERQEMFSQSRYSEINSLDSLKLFLEEERNQYTEACLYYIKRDKEIQKKNFLWKNTTLFLVTKEDQMMNGI